MKSISILTVVILFMTVGCATNQSLTANKDVLRRAHDEVWSQGNLEIADELYAQDYLCHFAGGKQWVGLDGLKAEVTRHRKRFPNWREDIEEIIAEGEFAVTRWRASGIHSGIDNPRLKGKTVSAPEIAIHRFRNGKIVEQWGIPDFRTMDKQLND